VEAERVVELYKAGATPAEIAELASVSSRTINRRLAAAAVPLRPRGRPRTRPRLRCTVCRKPTDGRTRTHRACRTPLYPEPEPRPCEQCGTSFTPDPVKVARGAGRFHTYKCWNDWRAGRPLSETRWRVA